jgi:hypothetical protein
MSQTLSPERRAMASKRSNGEGSSTRYKDGRWCGRYWTITTGGKKKRVAIYGKTKAEVRAKLTKAIADRDAGLILETENPTVEKYLKQWLNNSVKASVKQRTYESYEYMVRKHLVPVLGGQEAKEPLSGPGAGSLPAEVGCRSQLQHGAAHTHDAP